MTQQIRNRYALKRPTGRAMCRCACLVPLRSMQIKICVDCGKEHAWKLRDDQKPLIGSNRAGRRTETGSHG